MSLRLVLNRLADQHALWLVMLKLSQTIGMLLMRVPRLVKFLNTHFGQLMIVELQPLSITLAIKQLTMLSQLSASALFRIKRMLPTF